MRDLACIADINGRRRAELQRERIERAAKQHERKTPDHVVRELHGRRVELRQQQAGQR